MSRHVPKLHAQALPSPYTGSPHVQADEKQEQELWPYMVMALYSYGPIWLRPYVVVALCSYGTGSPNIAADERQEQKAGGKKRHRHRGV